MTVNGGNQQLLEVNLQYTLRNTFATVNLFFKNWHKNKGETRWHNTVEADTPAWCPGGQTEQKACLYVKGQWGTDHTSVTGW